jgi:DNA modification methylase
MARAVTLSWEGRERCAPDEPAPPRQSWATADRSGWLLEGDNLRVLRGLASTHAGAVSLAYLDPPFFTNREHAAWLRKAGAPRTSRTRVAAFDDRWTDLPAYLDALGARLDATRELLAPHGSIVVHVDPKTSHYVRVLGDELFGADAFVSEIVWRYRRWPSKTPNFQRVHDVLLRWRKDPRCTAPRWNQPYEPLAASTLATWGTNKQRAVFAKDGRRARSSSTEEPTAGVPMGDVWEIGVIAPIARERTGYPSQKPEALLERLLAALTNEGDLVLDPYAGSGTTLAVASRMRRGFVGIDASPVALQTTRERLAALGHPLVERAWRVVAARAS